MAKQSTFRCLIVGEGTLPHRCAEIWQDAGHQIAAIITPTVDLQRWAAQQQIPYATPGEDLQAFTAERPFDYLFSIVNTHILPEALLQQAERLAVNYHDAPLPRYAGVHATAWALLNGEREHGVTWHVMTDVVDAGDILQQRRVPITGRDTALALNAKCYDAALEAFQALVEAITRGTVTRRPQDLSQRTYFAACQRPKAAAFLSWEQPAAELERLIRALHFGPYPNRLGVPRLFLGETYALVEAAEIEETGVSHPPGAILDVTGHSLTVATSDAGLKLGPFTTPEGRPLPAVDLLAQHRLHVGGQLPTLPPETRAALTDHDRRACRSESFWQRRLASRRPISLPYLPARLPERLHPTAHRPGVLPPPVVARWRQEKRHATHFLLAAWAIYLIRLSGETEIDIGLHDTDRLAQRGTLASCFAATVPLRLHLDPDWTVDEAIKGVASQRTRTGKQDTFWRDLVARFPTLQEEGQTEHERYPLAVCWGETGEATPNLSAALILGLHPDREGYTWRYDPAVVDEATLERIDEQFATLLQSMLDGTQLWTKATLLPDGERERIVVKWNETAVSFPTDRLLPDLIAGHARHRPDAPALVAYEGQAATQSLSYAELERQANQLAGHLRHLGLRLEQTVAVLLPRSPELILAKLAIWKAGGAYLPIAPDYPPERIAFMCADALTADPAIVITTAALADRLPSSDLTLITLDDEPPPSAGYPQTAPPLPADPPPQQRLAYIIYTSGTTGRPKGVQVAHGGLLNLLHWRRRRMNLQAADRFAQVMAPAFDGAVTEIWSALAWGASLHIPDADTRLSPWLLRDWYLSASITCTIMPTPLAEEILSLRWPPDASLRLLCTGGDKLQARPSPSAPFQLVNEYGPTENTVATTYHFVDPTASGAPPIGRPIANTEAYVLDAYQNPVPPQVPGELYVGGAGLALGYLNRPGLTADRFVSHPFQPGKRLYRSGDQVMWDTEGNLHFIGRLDHQVKIRGFRIELPEIEAILSQHRLVSRCVVIDHDDGRGLKRLIAYVVTTLRATNTPLLVREWRHFLQERLPEYMAPSHFVTLKQLPLTPNGKVDREALPSPAATLPTLSHPYTAPRTPLERTIAAIWSDVLGLERVGVAHDFFELGGNSLLATHLISRLQRELGISLSLRDLLEAKTVANLAETVEMKQKTAQTAVPLHPIPRPNGIARPSSMQRRLWFLSQWQPDTAAYHMATAIHLRGNLNAPALRQTLVALAARHEALRTGFIVRQGQPYQQIVHWTPTPFTVIDLRQRPSQERRDAAAARLRQVATEPFDLTAVPLWRATLFWLDEDESILLLTLHHIIGDGWSVDILLRELAELYETALASGALDPTTLSPLSFQYADFAAWQQSWQESEAYHQQLAYWRDRLAGPPPPLDLLTDYPRPSAQRFTGATHAFTLPPELAKELRSLARQQGVTLFMLLLAAFYVWLSRRAEQEDIVVAFPAANRQRPEVRGIVGFFVNTIPLRADLSGDPTFTALLAQVRAVALGAYANQEMPFATLVQLTHPEREGQGQPLAQVMFDFQDAELVADLDLSGLEVRSWLVDTDTAKFELSLTIAETDEGLRGEWEYRTDLFAPETLRQMTAQWRTLLAGIVADPEQPIGALPLLTEAERVEIVKRWNDTAVPLPDYPTAHHWIAAQAKRTPDAIAVEAGEQTLTYAELERRANQLAHILQEQGIGPDAPVGLCLERTPQMVIALLGVLKAGGAYVPIDPIYPAGRQAMILQDAAPPVLVTHSALDVPEVAAVQRVIYLDRDAAQIAAAPETPPPSEVNGENLAYLIYTSGSTGRPKGVMVHHRALLNLVAHIGCAYQIEAKDRVLQFASISFDVAGEEIYPALCRGATLVLRNEAMLATPHLFWETCARWRLTLLNLPTSFWHRLVGAMEKNPLPETVRLLVIGGERAEVAAWRHWRQVVGAQIRLLNAYGPTETTVTATICDLTERDANRATSVPIGRPIANTQAYILDKIGRPCPIGVPGELVFGGLGVARGYLNRPQQTAAAFLDAETVGLAVPAQPGAERLYRTGDRARYLNDGHLEFLGREDNQVKIRGYRIELGEIEAILLRHPDVSQAAALVRESEEEEPLLVAAVAAPANPEPPLRDFCAQWLPRYMTPAVFLKKETLPVTPSGKIDRRALTEEPLPVAEMIQPSAESNAPRTPLEQRLAALWAEVLDVPRPGIHDDFFDLGGHSLLATQLLFRINETCGVSLPLRHFFRATTVAKCAALINAWWRGEKEMAMTRPDLAAEAELDPAIRVGETAVSPPHPPRAIFLTGATGFLGPFLLRALHRQWPESEIYCLVRATDATVAGERLRQTLARYVLAEPDLVSRLIPVAGDLSQPHLGLAEKAFHRLADQIDAIYHNGAWVHFLYPYQRLKATNVTGTVEVLRLATLKRPIPLHYVSTLSVFDAPRYQDGGVIGEEEMPAPEAALLNGYAQSKWVAERLAAEAGGRGVPVAIYRLGLVAGDSEKGRWGEGDFLSRVLQGAVQLGMAPTLDQAFRLMPVDYAAEAIVTLAATEPAPGRIFPLQAPAITSLQQMRRWLETFGYRITAVSYPQWQEALLDATPTETGLYTLRPIFLERIPEAGGLTMPELFTSAREPHFSDNRTRAILAGQGLHCPLVDKSLFHRYLAYFVARGFLPPPPA